MKKIYDMMAARLAQPDMAGLLVAYRNDFEVHDRENLLTWGAPGIEYLWLVRECGTNLVRLGVHPKPVEWFTCAMELTEQSAKVFHVSERGVKEVSRDAAIRMLGNMNYSVQQGCDSGVVLRRGEPIAHYSMRGLARLDKGPLWHLEAHSRKTLTSQEVGALRLIVLGEHELKRGFWAEVGDLLLDGGEFSHAFEAARQRETCPQQTELLAA